MTGSTFSSACRNTIAGLGYLLLTGLANPALASAEQTVDGNQQATHSINLKGFNPDKSSWSKKQIRKYEAVRNSGGNPLAMLRIERLNLEAPVYYGTDKITLDRGLGLVEGTANLDEIGNIGLSGHRDGFFRPLKDVKLGDIIEMQTATGTRNFEVSDISIVDALDISVLDPSDTTVLTLITCHPFYYVGFAPDRYIVRAQPLADQTGNGRKNSPRKVTEQLPDVQQ